MSIETGPLSALVIAPPTLVAMTLVNETASELSQNSQNQLFQLIDAGRKRLFYIEKKKKKKKLKKDIPRVSSVVVT